MRSWRNQNFVSDSFIELDKRKHPTINHDSKNDHMYVDIINCPPIHRAACQKASILMLFIHHIGVTDSAVKETTGMNAEELRFRRRIWHFFHREDCKDENRARSWNSTYCSIHGIDWSTRKERWEDSRIHGSEKARITSQIVVPASSYRKICLVRLASWSSRIWFQTTTMWPRISDSR